MLEDYFYHVYNRGNNRETIFKEEKNYFYFLEKFEKYLGDLLDVYAYCLMPNHFHYLVKSKESRKNTPPEVYKKAFKDFFISYSKSINKYYNRTGSLFQPKYKKKLISETNHLYTIIPYIHNNPLRAGLVKRTEDWIFSSYNDYLFEKVNLNIRDYVFALYSSKNEFIEFHKTYSECQKERDYLFK